jgi:hypothetical protein
MAMAWSVCSTMPRWACCRCGLMAWAICRLQRDRGQVLYETSCPCCAGSIGQLTADYGISAYLRDDKGLFVNLYTPSRVVWRRHGDPVLTLTQQGNYPLEPSVRLDIETPACGRDGAAAAYPGLGRGGDTGHGERT